MSYIIGADEVGRGCVAGDVFVAAVLIAEDAPKVEGVGDSKKLSPATRERVYAKLVADPHTRRRVARRSAAYIDAKGLSTALRECFTEVVQELLQEHAGQVEVRIDGSPFPITVAAPVRFIIRGDGSEYAIGAASIIAKVERDAYMVEMDKDHPGYGWARNAGYGTPQHIAEIRARGLTPLHRATFCRAWASKAVEVFEDPGILDIFG